MRAPEPDAVREGFRRLLRESLFGAAAWRRYQIQGADFGAAGKTLGTSTAIADPTSPRLDGHHIARIDYVDGYTVVRLKRSPLLSWLPLVGGLAFTWSGVIVIRNEWTARLDVTARALEEEAWHVVQQVADLDRVREEGRRLRPWGFLAAIPPGVLFNPLEREAKLAKWTHLRVPSLDCPEAAVFHYAVRERFADAGAEFASAVVRTGRDWTAIGPNLPRRGARS